jgi:hypothetical protein
MPYMGHIPNRADAYFRHHDSVDDLENAANKGCDVCNLIVNTLKGYEEEEQWTVSPDKWVGSECDPEKSLFAVAQRMPKSNVSVSIASGTSHGATRNGATLLDTLLVQIGPLQGGDMEAEEEDHWEPPDFPHLCFKIVAPSCRLQHTTS